MIHIQYSGIVVYSFPWLSGSIRLALVALSIVNIVSMFRHVFRFRQLFSSVLLPPPLTHTHQTRPKVRAEYLVWQKSSFTVRVIWEGCLGFVAAVVNSYCWRRCFYHSTLPACIFFDTCVPRWFASFVLVQQSFFLVSLGRPHCIGFICRFQAGLGMWLPGESEDNILVVFQHFCIIATEKESCSGHGESIEISQGSVLIYLPQLDSILPCVFFGSEPQVFFGCHSCTCVRKVACA